MPETPRKPVLPNVVLAVVLLLPVYALSYAPAVRFTAATPPMDDGGLPIYRPVDWMIDETPFQRPLLSWAEMWGVRQDFEAARVSRLFRQIDRCCFE